MKYHLIMRLFLCLLCFAACSLSAQQLPDPGDIIASDSCSGKTLRYRIADSKGVKRYHWHVDDPYAPLGNAYTDSVYSHIFNKPGNYNITLTLSYGYRTLVLKKT